MALQKKDEQQLEMDDAQVFEICDSLIDIVVKEETSHHISSTPEMPHHRHRSAVGKSSATAPDGLCQQESYSLLVRVTKYVCSLSERDI